MSEKIDLYDHVVLKDGREGCVVEVFDQDTFIVDVGSSPKDWETLHAVKRDDIIKATHQG